MEVTDGDAELEAVRSELADARGALQAQRDRVARYEALQDEARELQGQGDYEAALSKADEAMELVPEDAEVLALRGEIEEQLAAEQERERVAAEVSRLSAEARRQDN